MSSKWILLSVVLTFSASGCVNSIAHSIPARRLPAVLRAEPRTAMVPIDFTLLQQKAMDEHIIGPGDVLGIHIQEVVGKDDEPQVFFPPSFGNVQYGNVNGPAAGSPVTVRADGTVVL